MHPKNGMRPVHPGEILREELETLDLSANALSKALGVPVNRITAILNGQRGVTADTALRLARYFETTPQVWLNLQQTYDLRRAEIAVGATDHGARAAATHSSVGRTLTMRLFWNEIRTRAVAFTREWAAAAYEKGETQSFYNEFFEIFGVRRRNVARYEEHVQRLDNTSGFIDLFWPGRLLVEQKSVGRDLIAARDQAGTYFDALPERARPRYRRSNFPGVGMPFVGKYVRI